MLQNQQQEFLGTFYALGSGLLYGTVGYFGMVLIQAGLSPSNMLFWRFLVSAIFASIIFLFKEKISKNSVRTFLKIFLYGGGFYSISTLLYFEASISIGTGPAMVIFFTYPAIVAVVNLFLYKEVPPKIYYIALTFIFLGLFLLGETTTQPLQLNGIFLAVIAAAGYAAYVIFSKTVTASGELATSAVSLGCMTTALLISLFNKSFFIPSSFHNWLNISGIAIFSTALPIFLLLESLKTISATKASILSVLEPVFVVLFGIILLHETITLRQGFGIAIILIGALLSLIKKNSIKESGR